MSVMSLFQSNLFYSWGYWIVFISIFFEALPFFGIFIPGQMIFLISGFLSKTGVFNLQHAIIAFLSAAILGDLTGYFLGKKHGYEFLEKYGKYFFMHHHHLEKTKEILTKHPGETLIIARLNSLTRAFTPFIAGAMKVKFRKFLLYDLIIGSLWSLMFITAGYFLGESYEIFSKILGKTAIILFLIIALSLYFYHFISRRKKVLSKEYAIIFIIGLSSIYLFIEITANIIQNSYLTHFDHWFNQSINFGKTLTAIAQKISVILSPEALTILSAIIILFLFIKKQKKKALTLLSTMTLAISAQSILKAFLSRTRPINQVIQETGFSFPSGHSTIAMTFFFTIIYLFQDKIKNKTLKSLTGVSIIILPLFVAISRLILKVHWLTDVLAGLFLGMAITSTVIILYEIAIPFTRHFIKEEIQKHSKKRHP